MTYCLKRKNKKRFFSFQSMPNLNFAELIYWLYGFRIRIHGRRTFTLGSKSQGAATMENIYGRSQIFKEETGIKFVVSNHSGGSIF
jgi:hypothetical protein